MTSYKQALATAQEYLAKLQTEIDEKIVLSEDLSEHEKGWIFSYNTKEFFDTGNPLSGLAGNAPFLVERDTGNVLLLGTDKPAQEYL